ncbi:MAG TPA: BamA/TamA family outer membrane protein, partial [Candidatus Krumholzibacteria bacterium]|nr:BamA/TamA family outer membrane protein [Candidatus Krumholzibacteria bacterium]
QAFAEPSRRRIVLPFTSSFKEFQHTAIHELAHVFTFNIVYNRMLDNVFTRNYLFPMPLWVAEGLAEYLAEGWDADADMFVRDAVLHDYLYPFYAISGFYVYKEGQSVFNYIAETYGHEKVLEILNVLAGTRSAEAAIQRTIGLSSDDLYEHWSKSLRMHYWPLSVDKQEVDDIARRLTDHRKNHGYYNTKPVLSPDGESIVFFCDRNGLIEIRVISALDGTEIAKVVTGARSNRYETLHLLTSSICFDPEGKRVAFVAKSKGHDALFVRDIKSGDERRYEMATNGLTAPAWNPVRDEIALSATFHGQTDLVTVDLATGLMKRLTSDAADQLTPRYYPDGNRIVFVYYPEVTIPVPSDFSGENRKKLSEMDFAAPGNVRRDASYDIWDYDIPTGRQRPLVESDGDDTEPVILSDGKTLIYASDESGINNLHAGNVETREFYRFTDVIGGLFTPSVNEEKGRIAFSGFVDGGWDVYVSDDLRTMLNRKYAQPARSILAHDPGVASRDLAQIASPAASDSAAAARQPGAIMLDTSVSPDSGSLGLGLVMGDSSAAADSALVPVAADSGTVDVATYSPPVLPLTPAGPLEAGAAPPRRNAPPHAGGLAEAVGDDTNAFRGASVHPYKMKLSPDFIGAGGGLYFSSNYGFGIANAISMSDMLGDHRATFAFSLYQDLAQSDFLLAYSYLKRRADFSLGAYQLSSYYDSRITSAGEFSPYRLFSERNLGLFGQMSVPFNKFYRMDLDLNAYMSEREFYGSTVASRGIYRVTARSEIRLLEPSLAFVHDSALFGPFGPVDGSRWRVSVSQGVAFSDRDISRTTGFLDWRWYNTLFWRNSLALRLSGAASEGEDPRVFSLGGPTTLRGYDYQQFWGTRMWLASVEYRFPLLDALIFGWPGRWGFTNIGGTAFFDVGRAFNDELRNPFNFDNGFHLDDSYADVGVGAYMYVGYFLMSFQFAWPTDLNRFNNDMQFHWYLGPTF